MPAFAAPIVIAAALAIWGSGVFAQSGMHGAGHARHHDWYRDLKQPGTTYSCCNDQDCRPVRAVQREGGWLAWFEGEGWVPVPRAVILPDDLNREPLEAHACRSKAGSWYCFLRKGGGT